MKNQKTYTVYGIKNCDTVKKALKWLNDNAVPYEFHDYKLLGISKEKLKDWAVQVGVDTLLNRKGMTWRKLTEKEQASAGTFNGAMALMQSKTSVIRRPLIELDGEVKLVGFNPDEYTTLKKK